MHEECSENALTTTEYVNQRSRLRWIRETGGPDFTAWVNICFCAFKPVDCYLLLENEFKGVLLPRALWWFQISSAMFATDSN